MPHRVHGRAADHRQAKTSHSRADRRYVSIDASNSRPEPQQGNASCPRSPISNTTGREHPVDVPVGKSVMQGAIENNVPGIDADCGGECACATCHVYVDAAWLAKIGLPPAGSQEASMLSFAAVTQPDSAPVLPDPGHQTLWMGWSCGCRKASISDTGRI